MMMTIQVIPKIIPEAITTIQGNREKSRDIGTLFQGNHYSGLEIMGASHSLPGHHSGEREYCAWYRLAQECSSCAGSIKNQAISPTGSLLTNCKSL